MGRIKTTAIKSKGQKIFNEHKEEFTTDFAKNKEIVRGIAQIPSKKIRNILTGYITRLKKTVRDWEVN